MCLEIWCSLPLKWFSCQETTSSVPFPCFSKSISLFYQKYLSFLENYFRYQLGMITNTDTITKKNTKNKKNTNTGLCAPVCGSGGVNPIWSPAPQRLVTLLRVALPRFLQHWDLYLKKKDQEVFDNLISPCFSLYFHICLFLIISEIRGDMWMKYTLIQRSKAGTITPVSRSDLTGRDYQFKIHLTNQIYKNATLSS